MQIGHTPPQRNQRVSCTRANVSTFHSARRKNKFIVGRQTSISYPAYCLPRGIGCTRVIAPVLPSHFARLRPVRAMRGIFPYALRRLTRQRTQLQRQSGLSARTLFGSYEWLLYSQHVASSAGGRAIARGSVIMRDGAHVASVVQEGLSQFAPGDIRARREIGDPDEPWSLKVTGHQRCASSSTSQCNSGNDFSAVVPVEDRWE
jgi:hypothetical protein